MQVVIDWLVGAFQNFATFGWRDLVDILIMTYLIYAVVRLVRQTRAIQLVKGILIMLAAYFVAYQFGFKTVLWLIQNVMQIGVLAIVIVFQPELRRALEQVGRGNIKSPFSIFSPNSHSEKFLIWNDALRAISQSAAEMAENKCGALIVIERYTLLDDVIHTGTPVDAKTTSELLETIFYEGSPLHDGAVVARNGRIVAAGCLLPLTSSASDVVQRDMGTRHRAAIGMSESADALVVVVSEETGIISLATEGHMIRNLTADSLLKILTTELIPAEEEKKKPFWKRLKKDQTPNG